MRMRRLIPALGCMAALAAIAATPASAVSPDGRYIVVLKGSSAPGQLAEQLTAGTGGEVTHVYRHALSGFSAELPAAAAAALEANPAVDYVQPDFEVSTAAQTIPTGINRIDAELSPTANINGVDDRVDADVAVIDTGVDLDHPDLNVFRSKNCTLFGLGSADDQNGHGSHVAGTIGAKDNTAGVVGVAPGARIWAVKVLNAAGVGLGSDIICGIDYVTANAGPLEVANMSLGGGGSDDGNCGNTDGDAEHQAICRSVNAGVTYAVAAGNESSDASGSAPAAYDEVITVSALTDFNGQPGGGAASTCTSDVDDTFADYSNFGADVDVIAPGTCINSTYMNGGYSTISGTSMASPHVAGAAALYIARNPSATPAQVRSALQGAGNLNWTWPSQDPDGIQERLLNVAGF
jgi:subtilisin family serine protease